MDITMTEEQLQQLLKEIEQVRKENQNILRELRQQNQKIMYELCKQNNKMTFNGMTAQPSYRYPNSLYDWFVCVMLGCGVFSVGMLIYDAMFPGFLNWLTGWI